jgi:hypothetical protein
VEPETHPGLQDVDHLSGVRAPDGLEELDRRLARLCREQGPLRAVVARIAWRLVDRHAPERIGFARLSDYAVERLGCSGRSLQSLARAGRAFVGRPQLERALVSGQLGWTKVRLLAGLPPEEDVQPWIARAEGLSADELAKRVRAVDRYSVDQGVDDAWRGGGLLELRCSPEVRRKWGAVRGVASRAAGQRLSIVEAAEQVAAEVLSALPNTEPDDEETADKQAGEPVDATQETSPPAARSPRGSEDLDPELLALLEDLEDADAFELDARLQRALAREQSLEARIAPLLFLAWRPGVSRALGFRTREAWARERLGMDPTRARALVRLERACAESPSLARAWRTGALSWVRAGALVPLVSEDPLGRFIEDWVRWAGRVTVRRLRDDVEQALVLAEADPEAFRSEGGLPADARDRASRNETDSDREIRAIHKELERDSRRAGRGFEVSSGDDETDEGIPRSAPGLAARAHAGLSGRPGRDETCWVRLAGSPEVVRLFRAALCTVRRRIEAQTGRLPTAGEALGAMLDHAFAAWGADAKVAARHRVFARDGWRCAAPGCSSLRNLHDHHVRFRSAGGSNALENRVTLCAFHHLRGVHAGRLRCVGRAPDGLTWQLGVRPGVRPLLAYRSSDVRIGMSPS